MKTSSLAQQGPVGIPGYPSFGGGGEGGEEGGCGFCAHWCKAHFYLALFAYLLCLSLLNLRPAWVKNPIHATHTKGPCTWVWMLVGPPA